MIINIRHTSGNATPDVVNALSAIKAAGGGELHFETGEYHFYKEGARKEFFAVSNNSACDKYIVFPVVGMRDLVIDGHGAVLQAGLDDVETLEDAQHFLGQGIGAYVPVLRAAAHERIAHTAAHHIGFVAIAFEAFDNGEGVLGDYNHGCGRYCTDSQTFCQ